MEREESTLPAQLAFMGSCLTSSRVCLPSHVSASFAFVFKKNESAYILGEEGVKQITD